MDLTNITPVRVGGFDIAVEEDTERLALSMQWAGYCGGDKLIKTRTDGHPQQTAQSILHELCHAIEDIYLEGDELTERQIAGFSQGLYQTLKDNFDVFREIVEA